MCDEPIGLRAKAMRDDVTLGGAQVPLLGTSPVRGAPFEKTRKAPASANVLWGRARGRATWRSAALAVGSP